METKIHAAAGAIALLTVAAFWLSTVSAKLFGDAAAIATVKAGILNGMLVLIPAMAIASASGFSLGKGWKIGPSRARNGACRSSPPTGC